MTGLLLRGLAFRWRTNTAVALGAALSTAVLLGALGAGDSVRSSLRAIALERLGGTVYAMESQDRFVRSALAGELAADLGGQAAALICLQGSATGRGGETRASPVRVLGVEDDFSAVAGPGAAPGTGEVIIDESLSRRLGARAGDEIVLRVPTGSVMPADAPMSIGTGGTAALRLTVKTVLPDSGIGGFSLRVGQSQPLNAFVSREYLAARIGRSGMANTLVLAPRSGSTLADVRIALADSWSLADAGIRLRRIDDGWELVSDRVVVDPPIEKAAVAAGGQAVLTWFVDALSSPRGSIPYSFVAGVPGSAPSAEPDDSSIVLNDWAARALAAVPGDVVELRYLVPGPAVTDGLQERSARFPVSAIVPIGARDRWLMPDFPGIAGMKSCSDWTPGVPIDLSRIQPRDQAYWEAYGGSPKAFVSVSAARKMWATRFGQSTAVRFPASTGPEETLASRIMAGVSPGALGLAFAPVRDTALQASAHGVDFGQLFLGLSAFLVAAALLLTGLLFVLSAEQRTADIGTYAAVGLSRGRIAVLVVGEGALVALLGGLAGILLGVAADRGIALALSTVWRDAVQTRGVVPVVSTASLVSAFIGGFAASTAVIAFAAARILKVPPARTLFGRSTPASPARRRAARPDGARRLARVAALCLCLPGAAACLLFLSSPAGFFAASVLLLAGGLGSVSVLLERLNAPRTSGMPTVLGVAIRNAARRRARSLGLAALAACGILIVSAVTANRIGAPGPEKRGSGTGGFSLYAETAVPVDAARERRLRTALPSTARLVGIRSLDGDDASCLNLNRAARPRLLGVNPPDLKGRFAAVSFGPGVRAADVWSLLDADLGGNEVPAVIDQSVATWGLGVHIGDALGFTDEHGVSIRIRLVAGIANSIFQGSLLVSQDALARHFPSTSGHSAYLVEAAPDLEKDAAAVLERSLAANGLFIEKSADRLARFDAVENAYLSIFGLLGWMGMLIATLGLAIVTARNAAESRGELALLRAIGLGNRRVRVMVVLETLLPLSLGLGVGLAAAAIAVIPSAAGHSGGFPVASLLVPAFSIFICAAVGTAIAAALALRGRILSALRNE